MARTTQPSTADLKREFDSLKADLGGLAKELRAYAASQERSLGQRAADTASATAGTMRDAAGTMRDNVSTLRDAVLERGDEQLQSLRAFAETAAGNAEDMVRQHPGSTVAGAAAVGFLIGALMARR